MEKITHGKIEEDLIEKLKDLKICGIGIEYIEDIRECYITNENGLVVALEDGTEIQLTIKAYKNGESLED